LLLGALLATSVCAQQTITSAALSGRVEDAAGAVVKDACVTARNVETNSTHMCNCDSSGSFCFPYMTVGRYELSVHSAGFAELKRQVTLTIGQALEMSLKLLVADINETVEATADLPSLETVRTQQAERLLSPEIDSLPLNGRNYLDLAALTPGVTRSNPVANQRFPETSAVPGTGVSITGQRFINNGFVIDGLSANDDAADLPGTFYSQEAIREFEVVTSGGSAQFGRASGGRQHHYAIRYEYLSRSSLRLPSQSALRCTQSVGSRKGSVDPGTVRIESWRAGREGPYVLLHKL